MGLIGFPSPSRPIFPFGRKGSSPRDVADNEIPTMGTVKGVIWGPDDEFDAGLSGAEITIDFSEHNAQVIGVDDNSIIHFKGLQDGHPYTLIVYYKGVYTPDFVDVGSWRGTTAPTWSGSSGTTAHLVDYITLYQSKGNIYGAASTGHAPLIPGRVFGFGTGSRFMGDGTVISKNSPVPVILPGIALEVVKSAALVDTGRVYAWGEIPGDNTVVAKSLPVEVSLPVGTFTRVMGSELLVCARKNDNTHWFWGRYSPHAVSHSLNVSSPISISLAFTMDQMAGRGRYIALGTDKSIWTWGANSDRLVADNTTPTYSVPYNYMAANTTIKQIASGFDTFHYLKTDGTIWSWGRGTEGQIGDGGTSSVTTPVQASTGVSFVKIAANIFAAMALTSKGEIYAWGYSTGYTVPTKISTTVSFKDIAGLSSAFFLLDKDGRLYASGDTAYGVSGTLPPEKVAGNLRIRSLPFSSGNPFTGDQYVSAYNFAL